MTPSSTDRIEKRIELSASPARIGEMASSEEVQTSSMPSAGAPGPLSSSDRVPLGKRRCTASPGSAPLRWGR